MITQRDITISQLTKKANGGRNLDQHVSVGNPTAFDGMDFDEMKNQLIYTTKKMKELEVELKAKERYEAERTRLLMKDQQGLDPSSKVNSIEQQLKYEKSERVRYQELVRNTEK